MNYHPPKTCVLTLNVGPTNWQQFLKRPMSQEKMANLWTLRWPWQSYTKVTQLDMAVYGNVAQGSTKIWKLSTLFFTFDVSLCNLIKLLKNIELCYTIVHGRIQEVADRGTQWDINLGALEQSWRMCPHHPPPPSICRPWSFLFWTPSGAPLLVLEWRPIRDVVLLLTVLSLFVFLFFLSFSFPFSSFLGALVTRGPRPRMLPQDTPLMSSF